MFKIKAVQTCVWKNKCNRRDNNGCPLENLDYDGGKSYQFICQTYYKKLCPPHCWEDTTMFNLARRTCVACGKEDYGHIYED